MSHHGRFARTAWIGLFALATLALAAMLLVPTAASADAPAPGWIEGRVTDSFGAGIAGVEVALFRAHDGVPVELSPGGAWSREATTTDEMGYYSVPVLEDGFVDVYFYDDSGAFSPGFFSAEGTASSPIASATPVEASLGTTTTAIDEMLLPTVSVSGTVRSTTGARLGGIRVYANQTSWSWRESSAVQATTDSRGRYSIPGVHANTTHTLLFSDLSSAYLPIYYAQKRSLASASPVGVAETATVGIDATLVPSGRISGTVRDSAGRPLSGIKVVGGALGDYYGYEYQPLAVTDSHGHYSIRGFTYGVAVVRAYDPRGRYRDVWYKSTPFRKDTFNASQLVVTTAGRTRTGIDFKLASAARVVGRVTSAGTGLAGAKVTAYRRLGDRWSWTDDALAAEDGTYVIGSLPGGIYLLKCDGPNNRLGRYAREYLGGSSSVLDATQISLPVSTTTTRADFDLAAGASVSGEIRRDDGTPMECYVEAHALDSEDIHYGVASAAGTYTVSGLPGGEYKIRYLPRTDARTAAGWYGQASESANATTLTVVADEATAGIDATLSAGFTISGAIHAPDGSGLSGYVQLRSGDDRGAPKWVQIGTDGEYEMTGVAAGQYSLAALPGDSSDEATVAAWHYPYGSASRGETFTIAGDFTVDATASAASSISGRVTGPGGIPVGYMRVRATLWRDDGVAGWVAADSTYVASTGRFSFGDIEPGTYKLEFADSWGVFATTSHDGERVLTSAQPLALAPGERMESILQVMPLVSTKLIVRLTTSASTPKRGTVVRLTASIRDVQGWPIAKRTVKFYRSPNGHSRWTLVSARPSSAWGWASCTVRPARTAYFRAVYTDRGVIRRSSVHRVRPRKP